MKKITDSLKVKKILKSVLVESGVEDSRSQILKDKSNYFYGFNTASNALAKVNQIGKDKLTGADIEDISVQIIAAARQLEKMLNYNGYNIKL